MTKIEQSFTFHSEHLKTFKLLLFYKLILKPNTYPNILSNEKLSDMNATMQISSHVQIYFDMFWKIACSCLLPDTKKITQFNQEQNSDLKKTTEETYFYISNNRIYSRVFIITTIILVSINKKMGIWKRLTKSLLNNLKDFCLGFPKHYKFICIGKCIR